MNRSDIRSTSLGGVEYHAIKIGIAEIQKILSEAIVMDRDTLDREDAFPESMIKSTNNLNTVAGYLNYLFLYPYNQYYSNKKTVEYIVYRMLGYNGIEKIYFNPETSEATLIVFDRDCRGRTAKYCDKEGLNNEPYIDCTWDNYKNRG